METKPPILNGMQVFIGAEHVYSPLGLGAERNFQALLSGKSGVAPVPELGSGKEAFPVGRLSEGAHDAHLNCLEVCVNQTNVKQRLEAEDTLVILSSTKGDLVRFHPDEQPLVKAVEQLQMRFNLKHVPVVVSNACISGVSALLLGRFYLESRQFKRVFIVGWDILSPFVLWGFQSFHALSSELCKPFDANRDGINLGEGAAAVLLSADEADFKQTPALLLEGATNNDANHISGPSRTGEGLKRSIERTLKTNGLDYASIDYINAHGTGTRYNDEMEATAFERMGLLASPITSLKGYFGHTLGASGLIEVAMCLQSLKHQTIPASLGYTEHGVTPDVCVNPSALKTSLNHVLKTASGFGGCNASVVLKNLSS